MVKIHRRPFWAVRLEFHLLWIVHGVEVASTKIGRREYEKGTDFGKGAEKEYGMDFERTKEKNGAPLRF